MLYSKISATISILNGMTISILDGCIQKSQQQVHVRGPDKNGGTCWNKLHDIRTGQEEDSQRMPSAIEMKAL